MSHRIELDYLPKVGDKIPVYADGKHTGTVHRVVRVVKHRFWDRELLDDMDDFDVAEHHESTVEVVTETVDTTFRYGGDVHFSPGAGDWFRFHENLFLAGWPAPEPTCTPLGGHAGPKPRRGDVVELVRREHSDYHVDERDGKVFVAVDHQLFSVDDGRLVYDPQKFEIVSCFASNLVSGGHSEGRVYSGGRQYQIRARPFCKPHYSGLNFTNKWDVSLQLARFPCPILTVKPVVETHVPFKSAMQIAFEDFVANSPALAVLRESPTNRWGRKASRPDRCFGIANVYVFDDDRVHAYFRVVDGRWELLGGFNWLTGRPRGLETDAEKAMRG